MTVIISVFSNGWALRQYRLYGVYMIYGSVIWSMSSYMPARSAKCGCKKKEKKKKQNYIGFVINAGALHAPTYTRTGFTLPPVGTIVCIQSTSGIHQSQTTTTQPKIYHDTHTHTYTHISISLIFNTSSRMALSEWNTEAQCCSSSSSKHADFTLILSA